MVTLSPEIVFAEDAHASVRLVLSALDGFDVDIERHGDMPTLKHCKIGDVLDDDHLLNFTYNGVEELIHIGHIRRVVVL